QFWVIQSSGLDTLSEQNVLTEQNTLMIMHDAPVTYQPIITTIFGTIS
ncbi:35354_t:CDS:1, partial [Racocetra persica]